MPVQSTRILVIEDEPAHAEAISRSLEGSEGTALRVLTSLQAYREDGLAWNPDIALIDLNLPDGRAMEVLTNASNPLPFPVIIMTSYGNERTAVEAMKSGALDYLVKAPEAFFGLSRSIERWLREWDLIRKTKAMQRETLARDEAYRRQFTHNASIMMMIDPSDGRIIDANHSAESFYGYALPQLLGMRIYDINILPEAEIKRAMVSAMVHHGRTFEFQHRLADGSVRDVEVSSSSILIGGRQILHSIIHDISDRKQAEESLRKISTAVEQSPSAIVITDIKGAIEYVNPQFSMMTGYTLDEVRGQNPRILKSGEFPPEVYKNLWDTILVGETWRGYFHNRKKNGDLYWEQASISPIRDAQGCITSFVAIKEDVTERMHMEARLRESEAKNCALIRAIPDLIFTNRVDGEFLDVHAPDSSLLLVTPETFLHRKPHDVLPKHLADPFSKTYVDTLASGTVHELNYSVLLGEQERFFEARMAPCTEDTLITIVRDVTERRLAEETLRSQAALLEAQMNSTIDGILVVSASGKRVLTNTRMIELFNVPADVVGDEDDASLLEHVVQMAKYPDRFLEKVKHLYANPNETSRDEVEFNNGMILDRYSAPVLGNDGKHYGRIWTFRDITERKRMEELINKRITALTQPMTDGVITFEDLFDIGELQHVQDEFAVATGVASIITRPDGTPLTHPSNFTYLCSEIIRKTEKGCSNCFKSDAILGRRHQGGPVVQRCLSGGLWDAGVSLLVGGHHVANWLIGQVRDDTQTREQMAAYAAEIGVEEASFLKAFHAVPSMSRERFEQIANALYTLANQLATTAYQNLLQARFIAEKNQAEAEIVHLNEKLEQRVKDRTALLEAANQELEAFSYSVSHDLRAPLRGIDGFSYALLEDYQEMLNEEGRRYVSRIRAGVQRMGQLIDSLLKLSHVGRCQLSPMEVNFSDLCSKVLGVISQSAEGRQYEFTVQPGLFVWADLNLLRVAVENIFSNAWKYTSKREITRIEVGEFMGSDGTRALRIRDNGAGFDMAYVGKLFNPFQRLHSGNEFEGTGIGLSIVQRIIHRHSGRIWAEGSPGLGATFYLALPNNREELSV